MSLILSRVRDFLLGIFLSGKSPRRVSFRYTA